MRLTVLGGGGFRVPLIYRALATEPDGPEVDELVLHDLDPARLRRIVAVLEEIAAEPGLLRRPRVRSTVDLVEAVSGADFVFSAIRVGGAAGRVCDERSALSHGVLGQETTGAGGICYGLRTVPVAVQIARAVRRHAPDAWLINFTNPAGMVTEAMSAELGDRVIGICDSPVGLFRRVARALGVPLETAWFDYAGLNHLGWLRRVLVDGRDVLPDLLADDTKLAGIEEARIFGPDWLRALGTIPNEYLYYWYYNAEAVRAATESAATRGEFVLRQQGDFFDGDLAGSSLAAWERTRREREESYMADAREVSEAGERESEDLEGGGYDRVALQLMSAIANDRRTTLILNVRNVSALECLDRDAVVEVPCQVDRHGARPLAMGALDAPATGLVTAVKAVERLTIEAALAGSREGAVRALALHPLVDSVSRARGIIDVQLRENPELAKVLVR
jgi:6-phospho-beta-glucosidase